MRNQNLKNYSLPKNWSRGKNFFYEMIWQVFFKPIISSSLPGTIWRKYILILFGSKLGKSIRLSPGIKIKMPWRLSVGDYSWIGEDVWIDNLSMVKIGDNVCVSQGVYFCTGNHDFKKVNFNLICESITVESESWIGSKVIIGPGNIIGRGSVIKMGSIITKDIPAQSIFSQNKVINNYFIR